MTVSASLQSLKINSMGIDSLPVEVYGVIAKHLCAQCSSSVQSYSEHHLNLYNLCLVNNKRYQSTIPHLYHIFNDDKPEAFLRFVRTLIQHPNLASHVKSVSIPTYWDPGNFKSQELRTFLSILRSRALDLGLSVSDEPLLWDAMRGPYMANFHDAMENMLLLHTPNVMSIKLHWHSHEERRGSRIAFGYFEMAARGPEQWHAMRCLRYAKLDVKFDSNRTESQFMIYLSSLATAALSLRNLQFRIFKPQPDYFDPNAVGPPMSTPTHVVDFLGGLRSLAITSFGQIPPSFELTLAKHFHHCKNLEEIQYRSLKRKAALFVSLMKPLSHLKRLGLILRVHGNPRYETIWDADDHNDYLAGFGVIAALKSLEVLRFDHLGHYDSTRACEARGPSMIVPFMRVLPRVSQNS
ncbi:hypothetical protein LX32DRAFT_692788 [Colletotrichum zoysiae]|uniref:Uncharacterized protein n=1 Tax=Colletotrichum zoysiae TaxID=1216348 RepID=A0AAD9M228_9PEZI|nr:hypothetical protein LX32DRAFT_692788 [Colletotrichum zoysiae]